MKYVIIIEWGGNAPPNKWYRRLTKLAALSARNSDVERAHDAQGGFVAQEGTILCDSQSQARTIATLATAGVEVNGEIVSPSKVLVAEAELVAFKPNSADYKALERLEAASCKRGPRKPADWVISCYEEGETLSIRSTAPVACPQCGGTHIHTRQGLPNRFADPGGDLLTAWVRMRFAGGRWERNLEGGDELPPETVRIAHRFEHEFVEAIKDSPLLSQIEGLSRHRAFQLLDAVLIARVHTAEATRLRARLKAITRLVEMGEATVAAGLLIESAAADILDVATVLGPDTAAMLLVSRAPMAEAPKLAAVNKSNNMTRFIAPRPITTALAAL